MLQKEFEERIGKEVSSQEYAFANATYMNTDMDKDEFCKEWMGTRKCSKLIEELNDTAHTNYMCAQQWREKCDSAREMLKETGCFIARQAYALESMELRAKAIELLGETEYLKFIVKTYKGHEFFKSDCELLLKRLEN